MGRGCFGTVAGYYNKGIMINNYYHNLSPQKTTGVAAIPQNSTVVGTMMVITIGTTGITIILRLVYLSPSLFLGGWDAVILIVV